jgi:hypothetical protein
VKGHRWKRIDRMRRKEAEIEENEKKGMIIGKRRKGKKRG